MTPTAQQIIERVAELYHTTTWGFYSRSRKRIFFDQRVVVSYICCRRLLMSASEVGRMMVKHYSSVLYYVKTAETWLTFPKVNPDGVSAIKSIEREFFE